MKKLLSFVLALVMAFSVCAVSIGEAAEVIEPAGYSNFQEHLQAFASSLNLQKTDLFVTSNAQGESVQLLLGMNDSGTINLMLGQNQQEIATLQYDNGTAYLSYQGQVLALSTETVQSFMNNLPQYVLGYLSLAGIDLQQIIADAQTLAAAAMNYATKFASVLEQSVDGNVVTITLNSDAFGEAFGQAIDELLADESYMEIITRYAGMFGMEFDAEQLQQAWQANRDAAIAIAKTATLVITVNNETGEFTANSTIELPSNVKAAMDYSGVFSAEKVTMNGVMTMGNGEQDFRIEVAQTVEMSSSGYLPTKMEQKQVVYQNGVEIQNATMAMEMNELGLPVSALYVISQQGQEIMRMQYADYTFSVYIQGQELIFAQYANGVLTMRLAGNEIVAREIENDADHITFEISLTSNGQTVPMYATYSIGQDANGLEYLQFDVKANDQTMVTSQLQQSEKQAFPLLKDAENITVITEEVLSNMLGNYIQMVLSNIQF